MIAKLIVWAPDREQARSRGCARAIDEYRIEGVPTTLPLLRALQRRARSPTATYGTATLEAFAETLAPADRANPARAPRRAHARRRRRQR